MVLKTYYSVWISGYVWLCFLIALTWLWFIVKFKIFLMKIKKKLKKGDKIVIFFNYKLKK